MNQLEKSGDNVRAVRRALEIVLAFTPDDFELSAGDLLKRVNLSRPTLYRLLHTLQETGFISSVGDPQRFRLGPSVAQLTHVWNASLNIAALAEPVMQRLWSATAETVAVFVPQGAMRLCVAELPSPQPLSFKRGVGYTESIVRGATGRALLAHLNASDEKLAGMVSGTDVELKALSLSLAQTRKQGYSVSRSELIEGAVAIAVPFFDGHHAVVGSIGVFGPEVRLSFSRTKEIAALLVAESQALSQALGLKTGT